MIMSGVDEERLAVADSPPRKLRETEEELLTTCDNELTLSPRASVALSSRARHTLAGADNECLLKGDPLQEDEVSSVAVDNNLVADSKNKPVPPVLRPNVPKYLKLLEGSAVPNRKVSSGIVDRLRNVVSPNHPVVMCGNLDKDGVKHGHRVDGSVLLAGLQIQKL